MRGQYSVHCTQSLKCFFKDLGIELIFMILSRRSDQPHGRQSRSLWGCLGRMGE